MTIRIALFLLAAAGLVFACIDQPSAPQTTRLLGPRAGRIGDLRGRPQTIDEDFAAIAVIEATFAGAILDSQRIPVVFLTNTSRLAAARSAGLDAFLSKRNIPTGNVRVLPATYSYVALKEWYDCAWPLVLGLRDGVLADIDESANRLRFGVATLSAQRDAQSFVTQCEIPSGAVMIEVVPPNIPRSGLNDSLRDSVRPLRGGIRIAFTDTSYECTLGIIGRYNDDSLAFLTASHCNRDEVFGGVDTTNYWQYFVGNPPDSIGRQAVDPNTFSGLPCPQDNPPRACRSADASLTFLRSTPTAAPGLIARTAPSYNALADGSNALDQVNPGRFVTAFSNYGPMVGTEVCKTGSISGTTCGVVRYTGVHTNIAGTNITLIWQTWVHARARRGDSGAPVYQVTSDSTVTFEGILSGGPNDSTYWFSTWEFIAWELFPSHDGFSVFNLYAYLGAAISGPISIGVNNTYQWHANAFGGIGSKSYQWAYKNAGSGTWNTLGTSASQTRPLTIDSATFKIRVRVIAGSDTAFDSLSVEINPVTGVDISGPTWVHANQVCHWTATPAGGNEPYTYDWDGGGDGTSTYGVYVLEHFWVGVTVTAANGSQTYNSREIIVDEGGSGC